MFGEQLSEKTITALSKAINLDREKVEMSDLDTLRYELEILYDLYRNNIIDSALELYINGEEVEEYGNIQDTYSLFMNDYENLIDNNN